MRSRRLAPKYRQSATCKTARPRLCVYCARGLVDLGRAVLLLSTKAANALKPEPLKAIGRFRYNIYAHECTYAHNDSMIYGSAGFSTDGQSFVA